MSERKNNLPKENWTQWRLKPYLSLNRKMLVLVDWGWKMLNWWIVIPVLAWHLQSAPNLQWRSNCTPAQSNNWTQFLLPTSEELWNLATRAFEKILYQFLWDGAEAVITRGWILRKPTLYSWLKTPPCFALLCFVQFPPLLEPAGGRSEREWAKIALFLGRARVSKFSRRREGTFCLSTSGHICDKCWQALEWVRWHFWADCSVVQLYVKDRRPLSVVSNPGLSRSFLLNLVNCTVWVCEDFSLQMSHRFFSDKW